MESGFIKELLYKTYKLLQRSYYRLFVYLYEKVLRIRLKNTNFSIICDSCIGGEIYHRLGLQFLSPTINLWIGDSFEDFLVFVENLKDYLEIPLTFFKGKYDYPQAKILNTYFYFQHYDTEEEANTKWESRKKRVNYENIYVISRQREGVSIEQYERLKELKEKGIIKNFIILGGENCSNVCDIRIKDWVNRPNEFFYRGKNKIRTYEKSFDYIKFLNEK